MCHNGGLGDGFYGCPQPTEWHTADEPWGWVGGTGYYRFPQPTRMAPYYNLTWNRRRSIASECSYGGCPGDSPIVCPTHPISSVQVLPTCILVNSKTEISTVQHNPLICVEFERLYNGHLWFLTASQRKTWQCNRFRTCSHKIHDGTIWDHRLLKKVNDGATQIIDFWWIPKQNTTVQRFSMTSQQTTLGRYRSINQQFSLKTISRDTRHTHSVVDNQKHNPQTLNKSNWSR